jgi:hypothetical protein
VQQMVRAVYLPEHGIFIRFAKPWMENQGTKN